MFLIPFPPRIDAEDCCVGLQRLNVPHCAARERIADLSVGVVAVAGIPFAWAIWHFFNTLLRDARWLLFPERQSRQIAQVVTSRLTMFGYDGSSGLHGGDNTITARRALLFPARRFLQI